MLPAVLFIRPHVGLSHMFVLWLTGIPASGKSTIAKRLAQELKSRGVDCEVLESDEIRKIVTPRASYTDEERDWFYGVMLIWLAKLLFRHNIAVIIDATGHKRAYRENARREFGDKFVEVYVKCSLETAMRRDPKGLYRAALEGRIRTLPGIQVPYEEPVSPDVVVDTEREDVDTCVRKILDYLANRGLLRPQKYCDQLNT